jgi:hydroxymethylglutaryl-CoA lyase
MDKIQIVEVGPRDGWQNLKQLLSFDEKIAVIDSLISSGISEMEATSFVSPKAIPQMADAAQLAAYCVGKYPSVKFWALAPNFRGVENAYNAGIRHVSYVISVSQTHNLRNINRTHEESFAELEKILHTYPDVEISIGLATALGCPFEGIPAKEKVIDFCQRLYDMGIRAMYPADTIGIADPKQVRELCSALLESFPNVDWQIHIHDTRGMGLVNTLAAIECGIKRVQSTLGGLGGCPFAPGASGNTATEDLVFMLERMGYDTGIDFESLLTTSKFQKSFVDGIYSGHQMNISSSGKCSLNG